MDKYPALSSISALLKFFGWAVLVIGVILLFVGLVEIGGAGKDQSSVAGMSGIAGVVTIGAGGSFVVMGLLTVAFGELIRVLIDIETNTRSGTKLPLEGAAETLSPKFGDGDVFETFSTDSKTPDPINDQDLMNLYGITFDGKKYKLNEYTYDKLADAVNFARKTRG